MGIRHRLPLGRTQVNKRMKIRCLAVGLGAACVFWVGCREEKNALPTTSVRETVMTWTNTLQNCRSIILTGDSAKAESCWNELYVKGAQSPPEVSDWIQLQVDILEKTRNDPMKSALRR